MYSLESCDKCKTENHEGFESRFCQCEPRNIWIAKKMRELGMTKPFKNENKLEISAIDNK